MTNEASVTLKAYAKINLSLEILSKRSDGYHNLESVMQKISLCDTVTVEKTDGGIEFSSDSADIPAGDDNLCVKAAKKYFEASGCSGGARIRLEKRIPVSAGLAGGSTDAAAVLSALGTLYPSGADISAIASKIGADVLFCLSGTTAVCTGKGDEKREIPFPAKNSFYLAVAKGKENVSTPEAYRLFDENTDAKKTQNTSLAMEKALLSGGIGDISLALYNSFEKVIEPLRPEVGRIKKILKKHGAAGELMSGSGPSVFGLFDTEEKARAVVAELKSAGFDAYFSLFV